jgi:hypothetical protein
MGIVNQFGTPVLPIRRIFENLVNFDTAGQQ